MEDILNIAKYISSKFKNIDEMKLQKLLYLVQRESVSSFGKPIFYDKFKAWKYGPVSIKVRRAYKERKLSNTDSEINGLYKYLIENVLMQYGNKKSWELSLLTHNQKSWSLARIGLRKNEKGYKYINIYEDINDYRPYDYFWDMYNDEFEDYDGR